MHFPKPIFPFLLSAAVLLGGCAYKIEIRQGSDQLLERFDDLQVGMTREQVVRLLGESATPRLFRDNALLYVYQERPSGFRTSVQRRSVELVFDDGDVLREINILQDDFVESAEGAAAAEDAAEDAADAKKPWQWWKWGSADDEDAPGDDG